MKRLMIGALGVCLLLSTEAGAQVEPRFVLEAISFKAIHETGSNWPGSDEVYVTIHVPGHASTRSKIFGNVDAGETMHFPRDQRCIFPIAERNGPTLFQGHKGDTWHCVRAGGFAGAAIAGPFFSFTVVLRERDECPAWTGVGCFAPGTAPGVEPGPLEVGDDLIGRHEVVYSREELIGMQVHQTLVESVSIRPPTCPVGQDVCEASDTAYLFTWSITRVR
jgi:hypothetical protein